MTPTTEQRPWSVLRQFVRPRQPAERCELCGAALAEEHSHLLEPSNRQLRCACMACSILFSGQHDARYRRVPPRADLLDDFRMDDEVWDDFHLPINLAFFVHGTTAGRVQAFFPSPAGATESLLALESWDRLVLENPTLGTLQPDVEALLVNRLKGSNATYLVSIDECYKLIGLIRTHWHGLSGGSAVWEEIGRYFEGLKSRSRPSGGTPNARPEL
jgi:Family of unknown function (DUF5947)